MASSDSCRRLSVRLLRCLHTVTSQQTTHGTKGCVRLQQMTRGTKGRVRLVAGAAAASAIVSYFTYKTVSTTLQSTASSVCAAKVGVGSVESAELS